MAPVDQFIAAIVQQESGGNYNAYSSAGAIGKYQIMAANVTPWAKQYLGRTITASQFRSSPALQDELGRAVLGDYYRRYGAQGAASAWYSGNPNLYTSTKAQKGGPSIADYVRSVMKRMGSAVDNIDLSKQPSDSPLNPWRTQLPPVQSTPNPISASTGMGLDAVTDPLGASTGGLGLGAADGTDPTPGMPVAAPAPPPPISGNGGGSVASGTPSKPGAFSNQVGGIRGAAIQMGMKALGVPYVWGGNSLAAGVDCSGLVQQALRSVGITVPRVSYAQLKLGPRVSMAQAQPGDLIGWGDGHHVAIYLGNNQILEAPRTGLNVRVRTLGDGWDRSQGYYAVSLANYYR